MTRVWRRVDPVVYKRRMRFRRTHTLASVIGAAGIAVLAAGLPAHAQSSAADGQWQAPSCSVVDSNGAFTYTTDRGKSLAPTTSQLQGVSYSHIAALPAANTLVGITKETIWRSTDAGCHWQLLTKAPAMYQAEVAAGTHDTAYVYGINRQQMYVVDGASVATRLAPVKYDGVIGLAADPVTPHRLRVVTGDGQIYQSDDDARTWEKVGHPATGLQWAYTAAFDPNDPDHVVVGGMGVSFVTFDGGQTWQVARGLSADKRSNMFTAAVSPVDSSVVWAEVYDLSKAGPAARGIYRSTDGGRTFRLAVDGSRARLSNGVQVYPSPSDPDVVYFVYGSWFGGYGTDIYRYTASWLVAPQWRLTHTHNGHDGVNSIVFNPADPSVMYLGLEEVGCMDFCR